MSSFITTTNSLTNYVQILFWHSLKQHGFHAYSLLLLFCFLFFVFCCCVFFFPFFSFFFLSECFYPYSKFINVFTPQEMPTNCIMTFQVNRKGELTLSIVATSFSFVTLTSSFSSVTSKCNTTKQLKKNKNKKNKRGGGERKKLIQTHKTKLSSLLVTKLLWFFSC